MNLEILKPIAQKLSSGRWYLTVVFSTSYCLIMLGLTIALLKKIIEVETYVALLGAFALIVREIADDYFKRDDRTKIENGGGNEPK
jgi:hypothetical protein